MRGQDQSSSSPFGYGGLESRVPAKHPLRLGLTPRVVQNTYDTGRARQKSAIDRRTTRHPGYAASQRVRKHAVITPDGDLWRACRRAMEPLLVAKREKRL